MEGEEEPTHPPVVSVGKQKPIFSKTLIILLIAFVVVVGTGYFVCRDTDYQITTPSSNATSNNKSTEPESNTETNNTDLYKQKIQDSTTAIKKDPGNVQNYIDKSEYEYLSGDKAAALATVEAGLVQAPNNDLLKNRKDVLSTEYLADPNQDTPRQ